MPSALNIAREPNRIIETLCSDPRTVSLGVPDSFLSFHVETVGATVDHLSRERLSEKKCSLLSNREPIARAKDFSIATLIGLRWTILEYFVRNVRSDRVLASSGTVALEFWSTSTYFEWTMLASVNGHRKTGCFERDGSRVREQTREKIVLDRARRTRCTGSMQEEEEETEAPRREVLIIDSENQRNVFLPEGSSLFPT